MVRVGTPSAVARPAWYDRNPVVAGHSYFAVTGPHTYTTRFTYTVPAGKKAMVEVMHANVKRVTAPTTGGYAGIYFAFTPSGGTLTIILRAELTSADAAAKDKESASIGSSMTLKAGDTIDAATQDLSTGGTIYYGIDMKITEFDA